ncbi:MAG: hypothetical protein ABIH34_02750 [Nanoarchaeota archaeon]
MIKGRVVSCERDTQGSPRLFKKGQFYLFTAILLIGAIATLVPRGVDIKAPRTVLSDLKNNFAAESPRVINAALANESNATQAFIGFTGAFVSYAQNRDKSFGMAYALRDHGVFIGNNLAFQITLGDGTAIDPSGTYFMADNDSWSFEANGTSYSLSLPQRYAVAAVFRAGSQGNVEVGTLG